MENKIVLRHFDGEEYYCLDITEEFVKRFGKCFSPIESVVLVIGIAYDPVTDAERLEYVYKAIFSVPDYIITPTEYEFPGMRFDIDDSATSIDISITFKNGEVLDMGNDVMVVGSSTEISTIADVSTEISEELEVRKVAFSYGMSGDHMLILTDAPKSAIEDWAREYNKGLEDDNNVYFKPLQKNYYVKVIADSEVHDLSWEDIQTIGFDESYDLGDYLDYEDN